MSTGTAKSWPARAQAKPAPEADGAATMPRMLQFELLKTEGQARRGRLTLNHGVVETPVFMPVGTYLSLIHI